MIETSKIKLTDIIPAEYNPRYISETDKLKLRNSLDTFGVVDPIIINLKNNHIIGGHQRFDVLLDKYMEDNSFFEELELIKLGDIGWAFPSTDLKVESDDHEKALNLALNKISGEWDIPKLENIFNELNEKGFNTELTGFDEFETNNLMFDNCFTDFYDELEDEEDIDDMIMCEGETPNETCAILLTFSSKTLAEEYLQNTLKVNKTFPEGTHNLTLREEEFISNTSLEED